jgi:hypothetical protein
VGGCHAKNKQQNEKKRNEALQLKAELKKK